MPPPRPDTDATSIQSVPEKGKQPNDTARSWPGSVFIPAEWFLDTMGNPDTTPDAKPESSLKSPQAIVTLLNEGFEGSFPSGSWTVFNSPTWDDETCKPRSGSKSAWCAGSSLPCTGDYANGMSGIARWGPFSLADAKSGQISWWHWFDIEANYDTFFVGVSCDGQSYYGNFYTGNTFGWEKDSLGFCNCVGDGAVYIALWFWSDASFAFDGVYVDDILVQKRTDGLPNLTGVTFQGWEWVIITSDVTGTTTFAPVRAGETSYIDVAWGNLGVACAGAHSARLLHRGTPIWFSPVVSLAPGYGVGFTDIPFTFPEGDDLDSLVLVIDDLDDVDEGSDEDDNVWTLHLSVRCEEADVNVGSGCSVVPAMDHADVRAYCDGIQYFLTDLSRIPGATDSTDRIESYRWISSTPSSRTLVYYTDGDNAWDDPLIRQCPASDAHVNTGLTFDFMNEVLDRNSYDSLGSGMYCVVDDSLDWWQDSQGQWHADPWFDNAFWYAPYGGITILRESDTMRSFAGCLDVIAHEWGHAITEQESNLFYEGESGALNESFSDMIGVAVGYANNDPDMIIGENAFLSTSALRNMADPHQYGQPAYYLEPNWWFDIIPPCDPFTDDNCGVHYNSGVPNKMFSLLSLGGTFRGFSPSGISAIYAAYIMYYANANRWEDTTNFVLALNGAVEAADAIDPSGDWARQTQLAWWAVGVCDCTFHTDPSRDGEYEVLDVVATVNVAFRGFVAVSDNCPHQLTDMNCDDVTDVLDVVAIVNVAFRGIPSTTLCSDACTP